MHMSPFVFYYLLILKNEVFISKINKDHWEIWKAQPKSNSKVWPTAQPLKQENKEIKTD